MTSRIALLGWLGALCALVVGLIAVGDAKVVAEGALLPWRENIREVEVLGVRLYVDEEFYPRLDVLTTMVLAGVGSVAAFARMLLAGSGDRGVVRFFGLAAAGAWWLAADEAIGLHETIGDNVGALVGVPVVSHPDDLIVGLYAVAGLAFLLRFRRILLASREASAAFAGAAVLVVVAALIDLLGAAPDRIEDAVEAAAAVIVLAAFLLLGRTLTLDALIVEQVDRAPFVENGPRARPPTDDSGRATPERLPETA